MVKRGENAIGAWCEARVIDSAVNIFWLISNKGWSRQTNGVEKREEKRGG
jgi:hypothetical protein